MLFEDEIALKNHSMKKLELHWQILIGLVLGAILGHFFYGANTALVEGFHDHGADYSAVKLGFLSLSNVTWMGDLFLRLLKMIVIPIIFCSLVVGVGHMPVKSLGKIGILTLLTFKGQMLLAAVIGLVFVNIMKPGQYIDLHAILDTKEGVADTTFITEQTHGVSDILLSMIPKNIFESLSTGSLLQIIVFAIIFGIALVQIKHGKKLLDLFGVALDTILKMTHWIMAIAPFGIFALITKTVALGGLAAITKYASFMATAFAALFTMLFVVGSIFVVLFTDIKNPLEFFSKVRKVMLTAFSTSSSAATIPVNLEVMEKNFKVPNRVASFVIPLGATMNMNGAAIYESIVTLFIAQAWLPEPLSLQQQIFVVGMVLLATFGTPGIPHGSLVTIAVVFQAVGLPLEAIGVILSIDRILDMTRTMVNVTFDSISCLILQKFSGLEPDKLEDIPREYHEEDEERSEDDELARERALLEKDLKLKTPFAKGIEERKDLVDA